MNAVYHRSYEEREPIEVRMEDLRVGKAVSRRYRNRRIGEFLKELDLTEGRSTGIPKILRAMKENGSPAPEFDSDDDCTYFLIRFPVHEQARPAVSRAESVAESLEVSIMHVLQEAPLSKADIATLLSGQNNEQGWYFLTVAWVMVLKKRAHSNKPLIANQ